MDFIQQFKNKKIIIVGLILILIMAGILIHNLKPKEVEAWVVTPQDYVPSLLLSGEVVSSQSIVISSLNSGTVLDIPVTKGEKVARGQLLIQLDDRQARIERDRAEVAFKKAQVQLQKAVDVTREEALAKSLQADLDKDKARVELERISILEKAGAASRAELEEAERRLKMAEQSSVAARAAAQSWEPNGSNLAILQAELEQYQLDLQEKELILEQYAIKTPVEAEVLDIYVQQGEWVSSGSPVALLSAIGDLRIKVHPDQRYAELARIGNKAQVWSSSSPHEKWEAQVVFTEPSGNAEQGSVTVELEIINGNPELYPGQLLFVQLYGPSQSNAIIIPENLLTTVDGQTGVWVAVDKRARFTPVQTGFRTAEGIVITSGLNENDIVLYPEGLRENQKVLPRLEKANHNKK